ncbi:Sucrose-binding protein [Bienertia sinuspersici]
MVILAGVTAYLINRGNNVKLVIVKLINPVSNPGSFEVISSTFLQFTKYLFNSLDQEQRHTHIEAAFKTLRDNLKKGSMHTPFHNSRATKIAVVVRGKGYFEMACPHVSESCHKQHHRRESIRRGDKRTAPIHYEKINSELRQGTVFVVPPGHPFVTVVSEDENFGDHLL